MAANPDQLKLGKTAEDSDAAKTAQMTDRLRYKFGGNEWSILFNVRNAGGFEATRTADAIAVGVWPSTGHLLMGFEIKVSRADWLRELKDPWKSEAFAKFCDRWWLVLAKADIVKPGELPDGWGIMVSHGHGLKVAHEAKTREKTEPLDRGLLAAMLKRASTVTTEEANAHFNRGVEHGKQYAHSDYKYRCEELERIEKAVKAFEEASGVHINTYRDGEAAKIGDAVRLVREGKLESYKHTLEYLGKQARTIADETAAAIEQIGSYVHPKEC